MNNQETLFRLMKYAAVTGFLMVNVETNNHARKVGKGEPDGREEALGRNDS